MVITFVRIYIAQKKRREYLIKIATRQHLLVVILICLCDYHSLTYRYCACSTVIV